MAEVFVGVLAFMLVAVDCFVPGDAGGQGLVVHLVSGQQRNGLDDLDPGRNHEVWQAMREPFSGIFVERFIPGDEAVKPGAAGFLVLDDRCASDTGNGAQIVFHLAQIDSLSPDLGHSPDSAQM